MFEKFNDTIEILDNKEKCGLVLSACCVKANSNEHDVTVDTWLKEMRQVLNETLNL